KAGKIQLDADQLDDFLTVRGASEAPENRANRASAVLDALSAALSGGATESTTAAPAAPSVMGLMSDAGVDIGAVIATMKGADFVVLPMRRQSFNGSYLYRPDAGSIASQLAGVVEFP